jgi:hypothetical protein
MELMVEIFDMKVSSSMMNLPMDENRAASINSALNKFIGVFELPN